MLNIQYLIFLIIIPHLHSFSTPNKGDPLLAEEALKLSPITSKEKSRTPLIQKERENRLLLTEAKFNKLLNESKEFFQESQLNSKCPSRCALAHFISEPALFETEKHAPIKLIEDPYFVDESDSFFCPQESLNKSNNITNSPVFCRADQSKIPEEIFYSCQTNEIYKKYMAEKEIQEAPKMETIESLSYTTLLRYLDVEKLFLQINSFTTAMNNEITREELQNITTASVKATLHCQGKIGSGAIFDILNDENNSVLHISEVLGGLSLFCSGSTEEKIRSVFRYMGSVGCSEEWANYTGLFTYLQSVFHILLNYIPNPTKTAEISIQELCKKVLAQFCEEYSIGQEDLIFLSDFIDWFSTSSLSLSPKKSEEESFVQEQHSISSSSSHSSWRNLPYCMYPSPSHTIHPQNYPYSYK